MSPLGAGRPRRLAVMPALVLAACAAAACFSERTSGLGTGGGECRVPLAVVDSQHVLVAINNFLFAPDSINVPPGTTVTWINCEDPVTEPHTTTSVAPLWDSGEFPAGQRFTRTFNTPGVFPYFCTSHSNMNGTVVVQ